MEDEFFFTKRIWVNMDIYIYIFIEIHKYGLNLFCGNFVGWCEALRFKRG